MSLQENKPYPKIISTAFGRVFYGAANLIMFSQVLFDDIGVIGKCYQKNDPTSAENPDIIATDGGELTIQDAGNIIAMQEFRTGLVIFAERGIWFLTGPEDGFTALDYSIKKISDVKIIGPKAYASIGNGIMFATSMGIHILTLTELGDIMEQLMTEQTIDGFLKGFLNEFVSAHYDRSRKQVIWQDERGTRFLLFDIRLNAWYPQESSSKSFINKATFSIEDDVYYVSQSVDDKSIQFSQRTNKEFSDYGTPFNSYMVTNYNTGDNFTRYKGIPLLSAYFAKTEENITGYGDGGYTFDKPSGCFVSIRWDWNTSGAGGKWSAPVQMYRVVPRRYVAPEIPTVFDTGESVVSSKYKFRGTGRAVQVKFESDGNKDMRVLGYAFEMTSKGRQ